MISIYNLVTDRTKYEEKDVNEVLELIQSQKYLHEIAYFRHTLKYNPLFKRAYKEDRKSVIPAIQWNKTQTGESTSFMYFDFDYESMEKADEAKQKLVKIWGDGLYACWLSLSGTGLGVLLQADAEINEEEFLLAYDCITADFKKDGFYPDPKRRDFSSVNFLSYDSKIVINKNAIRIKELLTAYREELDKSSEERKETKGEKLRKDIVSNLIMNTQYGWRRGEYIKVKPKGKTHLEVNTFVKIKVGKRGDTFTSMAIKLLKLNPQPEKLTYIKQLIVYMNNYRTEKPWEAEEMNSFLEKIENNKLHKAKANSKIIIKNPTYKLKLDILEHKGELNVKSMEQVIISTVKKAANELELNKAKEKGADNLHKLHLKTEISKTTIIKYHKEQGKSYNERLEITDIKNVIQQINEFIEDLIQSQEQTLKQ